MDFFIKDFLNNPAGKGSTVLNINATKNDYIKRYDNIVKKIKHKTYFVGKDKIFIIVNIPSSVEGIIYDVVLKFEKTNKSLGISISDMPMQIFSNSPSFLYTYANAYDKQKLLIKECKRKLSSKMLKDIAVIKNPYGVLSYDFSVFSALFYVVNNGYLDIENLKTMDFINCNMSTVLGNIKNADTLQKERGLQKNYNKLVEEKNKKKKMKNIENPDINEDNEIKETKHVSKSKNVKKVKSTKKIGGNKH